MKEYMGRRGTGPLTLNHGTKWWWAVNFMVQLLDPGVSSVLTE
jgi:hypothetical protein